MSSSKLTRRPSASREDDPHDEAAIALLPLEQKPSRSSSDEYGGEGEGESLAAFYRPSPRYEGAHRFDPEFKWTRGEERAVVRRLDWKICAWVCLMFFGMHLDRANIVQANSDNILDDLGLNTNDYNTGQTIFFLSFIVAELPSQVFSKWVGPDRWIPGQMVVWSTAAACQAFMTGKKSFYFFRFVLGISEGGFVPSTILYLTYFYTSTELPMRLSYFWTAFEATLMVSSFLAFGILHLRGTWGISGWRWLFGIEGSLTCVIGIISYFYMPASPTQTASKFRGEDGWFSEREEKIMVNRILRDDPTKGDMHNREELTLKMVWDSLCDYDLWPIYLLGISWMMPPFPVGQYFTLLLRGYGFDTFSTNLLTIPSYIIFMINLLFWTRITEKYNERFLISTVSNIWPLICFLGLLWSPADAGRWSQYWLYTLIGAFPFMHAVLVAVVSTNAGSTRTRTVASAIYNMCVQFGNVIGANIYREDDKPLYRRGNTILIAICLYNIALFIVAKIYYVRQNERRSKIWDNMSPRQKQNYLATTKDRGNRRLDFRFVH